MKTGSLWLADVAGRPRIGDPLRKDMKLDVAIIGAGYVGLWTAIGLLEADPCLRVGLFDKGLIGNGASSLNGGFMMSWWSKIVSLCAAAGEEDGLWLADGSVTNLYEMADFFDREGIDAELDMKGWLWTATTEAQRGAWMGSVNAAQALQRPDIFSALPPSEIAARSGSAVHLDGILEKINGQVHPAKLAYGLAQAAQRKGALLFCNSPVSAIEPGTTAVLRVGAHRVEAGQVVIAANIAADAFPGIRNKMVLVTSAAIATPKIGDRLAEIGWTGGETVSECQSRLNYYRTTRDGRMVFGMAVANLSYGNKVTSAVLNDRSGIAETLANFRRIYPQLADIEPEYGWSGPIDRTYDGLPIIGHLPGSKNISFGIGWSGNGVGPSRMGAKMLCDMTLQKRSRWSENGFVDRQTRSFPAEPLRYLGGTLVKRAVARNDTAFARGRTPGWIDRKLAALAPAGTEDTV